MLIPRSFKLVHVNPLHGLENHTVPGLRGLTIFDVGRTERPLSLRRWRPFCELVLCPYRGCVLI